MNAPNLIRNNLDPDSNVTEESDLQSEKQFVPKNKIEAGTIRNSSSKHFQSKLI
jgi:hypothetical protein